MAHKPVAHRPTTHRATHRPRPQAEPIFPLGHLSAFGGPAAWGLVLLLLISGGMIWSALAVGRRRNPSA